MVPRATLAFVIERLTNAALKRAQEQASALNKRVEVWDTEIAALFVRVSPGGAATFYVKYRAGGRQRKHRLGAYGRALTITQARKLATKTLGEVADGGDPVERKRTERSALCMVDLLGAAEGEGWYLAEYVQTAGKLGTAKTEKGIANDRYAITKHLRKRPAFLRKRVDAVTVADLSRIKADVTPSTWRKLRNILVIVFRHAEELGAIPAGSNPASRTKAASDAKRERFLAPDERQRLAEALERAEKIGASGTRAKRGVTGGLSPHLVRALRLLSLTGMRRGDVLALRWEWIDWRHSSIALPSSKTGARTVPLTPQALEYLRDERGAAGRIGYVCSTRDGGPIHPENLERAWQSVREHAKLDGSDGRPAVRLHDLRHSWASDAVSAGIPLYVVGQVLGHKVPATTARYSHVHDVAVREALATAGAAIEANTHGEGKVVALPSRGRRASSRRRRG